MTPGDYSVLLSRVKSGSIPRHVGIIMDGNGRWAENRGLPRAAGHKEGVERVRELIPFSSRELGLEAVTLYVFSLENWQRPEDEIEGLMVLLEYFLTEEVTTLIENNISFRTCGDIGRLPVHIRELLQEAKQKTSACTGMVLNAALSYGGRDEIVRAANRYFAGQTGPIAPLTEETLANHLDTAGLPDPDLIIRTSGEQRVSNFLLWQCAYSEFYFTPALWPDFDKEAFIEAILDYQRRERRYGGISAEKS